MRHFSPPLFRVADTNDVSFASDVALVNALTGTDASAYMKRVTTLITRNGFFFLEPVTSSVLEAHMAFYPEGRGKEAIHAARAGLRHAFTEMGALVVFGRIPLEARAARLFTRMIGLKSDGIREKSPGEDTVEWFEARADEFMKEYAMKEAA